MPCNKAILKTKWQTVLPKAKKTLLVLASIMFFPVSNSFLCELRKQTYQAKGVLPNTKAQI